MNLKKIPAIQITLYLVSVCAFIFLNYFISREAFIPLISSFAVLFACYFMLLRQVNSEIQLKWGIYASIFFRVILLFSIPNLTDDFYRFIWDGRLWANDVSPYTYLPAHFFDGTYTGGPVPGITRELYENLNSKGYFSVYVPVTQFIFWIAGFLFPDSLHGSIIIMKLFILGFEIGSVFIIWRLLKAFNLPEKNVLLYALNPLVIVELTGNLHFEAAMIFFVLLAVLLLVKNRQALSAGAFAFAICSKLLPLMFLPLLIKKTGAYKSFRFYAIAGVVSLLFFTPFFDIEIIKNMGSSVDLYFRKFEFNASIYYLIRWIGFQVKGYNIIQTAGIVLGLFVLLSVIRLSFYKRLEWPQFMEKMMWVLVIFFMLATTVHPWYITSMVAFSVFTRYRFPVIWTVVLPLAYFNVYHENYWLIALEYLIVYSWMIGELMPVRFALAQRSKYLVSSSSVTGTKGLRS